MGLDTLPITSQISFTECFFSSYRLTAIARFAASQGFWAATSAAPGACRGKSSLGAFADKIAFELGQCVEYVKD